MSKLALLLCLALPSSLAYAETRLTIREAVEIALAHHPSSAALAADARAAEARRRHADTPPNPEADVSAGYKEGDAASGYEAEIALLFPLERREKRAARRSAGEHDVLAAEAAVEVNQREIEFEVRRQAYTYLATAADADIATETAERSRAMIELLKQRPVAGAAMLIELRVIEASLVEFQKSAGELNARRDTARRQLNVLLGREPEAPLEIADTLDVQADPMPLDELLDRVDRSPFLRKRLAEAHRAAQEAEIARWEGRSESSLGPYVAVEDDGEEVTTIGAALSVAWPVRQRRHSTQAAADAMRAAADARYEAERLAARAEASRLHRLHEAAVAQVLDLPPELVESFHAAADLADRQYRLGAIPVSLFLEMQREFLSVQQLRHNALLDALTLDAELRRYAGPTTREDAP